MSTADNLAYLCPNCNLPVDYKDELCEDCDEREYDRTVRNSQSFDDCEEEF